MKKKIAFIDLFIDEWHANNYPAWFKSAPRAEEFELTYAWEETPKEGGRNLQKWCEDFSMTPVSSIKEAVDKADCICVLAPANPEVHERLADIALASGKPLYIDKPFAPSQEVAERIFAKAEKFNTPLMSSSALRFGDELIQGDIKTASPTIFSTTGGGRSYHEYGIHQLEMIVSVMGAEVKNITAAGDKDKAAVTLEYADGRIANILYNMRFPFTVHAASAEKSFIFPQLSHTFENLIASMEDFFATGISPIPKEQTIAIAGLLERTIKLVEG